MKIVDYDPVSITEFISNKPRHLILNGTYRIDNNVIPFQAKINRGTADIRFSPSVPTSMRDLIKKRCYESADIVIANQ